MVYYRERPAWLPDEADGMICMNVGECQIDRVTAADLAGKEDAVANSFYITVPQGGGKDISTLLVTNGPDDFKKWILSFRQLKAAMLHGIDEKVDGSWRENTAIPEEIAMEEMKVEEIGDFPSEIEFSANEAGGINVGEIAVTIPKEIVEEEEIEAKKVEDIPEEIGSTSSPAEEGNGKLEKEESVIPEIERDASQDTLPINNSTGKGSAPDPRELFPDASENITSTNESMDANPFAIPPDELAALESPTSEILLSSIAKAGGEGENAQDVDTQETPQNVSNNELTKNSGQQAMPDTDALGKLIEDCKLVALSGDEIDNDTTRQVHFSIPGTSERAVAGDAISPEVVESGDYPKVLSSPSIVRDVAKEEEVSGAGPGDYRNVLSSPSIVRDLAKKAEVSGVGTGDFRNVLSSHGIVDDAAKEEVPEAGTGDYRNVLSSRKVGSHVATESQEEEVPELGTGDYRKVLSSPNVGSDMANNDPKEVVPEVGPEMSSPGTVGSQVANNDQREKVVTNDETIKNEPPEVLSPSDYRKLVSSRGSIPELADMKNEAAEESLPTDYRSVLSSLNPGKEVANSDQNENSNEILGIGAPSDYHKVLSSGESVEAAKEGQKEEVPQDATIKNETSETESQSGYCKVLSSCDVTAESAKEDKKDEDPGVPAEINRASEYRKYLTSRGTVTVVKESEREDDPGVMSPSDYRKVLTARKTVPKMARQGPKVDGPVRPILNAIPSKEGVVGVRPRPSQALMKTAPEGEMPSDRIKVFAHGDTYDEMENALDCKRTLFGILATSLDETKVHDGNKEQSLIAFSIEYEESEGINSDANRYKDHLTEIGAFCRNHIPCVEINPLVYDEDAKEQILKVLGKDDIGEKTDSIQTYDKNISSYQNISLSSTGMTAYKHALSISSDAPNGAEILDCVRQPLGTPYNWVLFQPSKEGLIVEDGGSGGVMEISKVLQANHNERVLFGMMRISFMGSQFGRHQFWSGLEWKGEDCYSVKLMRQFLECSEPMSKMIGDRSFTISANEITPEMVIEQIKRSCNVADFDLTVEAMKSALDEEQIAMKSYWDKLEGDARSKKVAAKEEEMKSDEVARNDLLDLRRYKWSKMSATELVEDLGKDMSGWVLLEVDV